jgi:hypothetical protein
MPVTAGSRCEHWQRVQFWLLCDASLVLMDQCFWHAGCCSLLGLHPGYAFEELLLMLMAIQMHPDLVETDGDCWLWLLALGE